MAQLVNRRQIREEAARDLGLFTPVTADVVDTTNHTIQISDLFTKFPDDYMLQSAWVSPAHTASTGNQFRRIVKPYVMEDDSGTKKVQLDGGPDGLANGQRAGVYFLLTPEDWNACINAALSDLNKTVRVSITLVNNDNNYPVDALVDTEGDLCTYLQSRAQIIDLEWRHANGDIAYDVKWAGVKYLQNAHSLTVQLSYMPLAHGSALVLVARKPYVWPGAEMNSDVSGVGLVYQTNCPFYMAVYAAQVKAMELLFNRHGVNQMRQRFAPALQVARAKLTHERLLWEPALQPASYQVDETFVPDIPADLLTPSW